MDIVLIVFTDAHLLFHSDLKAEFKFFIIISLKTAFYNLYDEINLFFFHLIVRRKTQTVLIQPFSVVSRSSFINIGVAASPADALSSNEHIVPVYGLQMHRLPDRPSFRVESFQRVQNLRRAAFSGS